MNPACRLVLGGGRIPRRGSSLAFRWISPLGGSSILFSFCASSFSSSSSVFGFGVRRRGPTERIFAGYLVAKKFKLRSNLKTTPSPWGQGDLSDGVRGELPTEPNSSAA